MFCVDALDVSAELGVRPPPTSSSPPRPATSPCSSTLPSYYPTVPPFHDMGKTRLVHCFPGMPPPIRAMDMLQTFQGKDSQAIDVQLYQFKRMAEGRVCWLTALIG